MKTNQAIFIFFSAFLLSSCFRLDSNLYNLSEKISEYKFDNYQGDQDFILDASYKIPDSLVHLFTLNSQAADESSATTIYAIYIGSITQIASDTVIMYCHGNKWHMDLYWQRAKLLANMGGKNHYGVLMIDYRGYGLSKGKPTEEGLVTDVSTALNWLKGKGLTSNRLMMYGFSLGSAPATRITANPGVLTPSKLILEAPFASASVMAQDAGVLDLPGSFFTNLKINNAEEIKKVKQPLLWIHGKADTFLNIDTHGEVVFKNYSGSYSEAHRIDGANHSDVPLKMGFQNYSEVVLKFIRR